jgi:RNA polymerase sigma-70 factor (ECF subfamily)
VTRIAINEALMLLRQRRAHTPLSETSYEDADSPFVLNLADGAPTPEQTVAANELSAVLTQAISDLRKNLRTVVLLREFQGLTNEETARRLGLTVAAVKARVFHARRWLRRRLERKLKPTRNGSLIDI